MPSPYSPHSPHSQASPLEEDELLTERKKRKMVTTARSINADTVKPEAIPKLVEELKSTVEILQRYTEEEEEEERVKVTTTEKGGGRG